MQQTSVCASFIFILILLSNAAAEISVSKENLFNHVKALTTTPRPRNFYNVASLDSAAAYIKTQFEQYGYSPNEQVYQVDGNDYRNIHVLIGPENTKRIVIGAHYDVCGEQAGADDNATAVAGLLELARIAKLNEKTLKNRLEFVAYTLEEPPNFSSPSMGSYVHAQSLKTDNVDVVFFKKSLTQCISMRFWTGEESFRSFWRGECYDSYLFFLSLPYTNKILFSF